MIIIAQPKYAEESFDKITKTMQWYICTITVLSNVIDFLRANYGDYVLIENPISKQTYIGCVIKCIGSSRSPKSWTLFQISNVDTGSIQIVNASNVLKILSST